MALLPLRNLKYSRGGETSMGLCCWKQGNGVVNTPEYQICPRHRRCVTRGNFLNLSVPHFSHL